MIDQKHKLLLVDSAVVPDVALKVLQAKTLLAKGQVKNSTEAIRRVGLSRSTYYKYKDHIFLYNEGVSNNILTVYAVLEDEPGVLSSFIAALYGYGANILTVSQNIPIDSVASVTVSLRVRQEEFDPMDFQQQIGSLPGVIDIRIIAGN